MKQLYLANEPSIGSVTLPDGDCATWFYNPDTTLVARFATKVVFRSTASGMAHNYILLLPDSYIDHDSTVKAWSIAEDLGSVDNQHYTPYFTDVVYALDECEITRSRRQ